MIGGAKGNDFKVGSVIEYANNTPNSGVQEFGEGGNPELIVISAILFKDNEGADPKAFIKGRSAMTQWPNTGISGFAHADHILHARDQSVKWIAEGKVDNYEDSWGEAGALATLDVTLSSSSDPEIIHSSEADAGNPIYT